MQDTQETRKDQQPEAAPAPRPEEPRFNTFEIGRELDELLRQRRRARGQDVEPEPPAATPDPAPLPPAPAATDPEPSPAPVPQEDPLPPPDVPEEPAPMGGQQKKPFVVTLPEEVYRIGEDYVPPKREEPAEEEPTSSAELGPLFDDEAEKKPARIFRGRLLGKEEVDLGREDDETEEDEEDDERLPLRSRKPRPAPRHPYDELPLKEAVTRLTNRAKFSTRCLW
ncbi:MAG: hypothetical protein IJC43_08665, partial [Clostridia bacterium]|nr:hypothetical protein [Clostridia bacterium]